MTYPTDIMVDPSNGNVYVSDVRCKNVYEFSHTGSFIGQFDWTGFKTATGVGTPTPRGIVMDENGNVYVLEFSSRSIVVFNQQGQYQRDFPHQIDMNDGRGLAIDTTHDLLYAIGALNQRMFQFNYQGTMLKRIDSPTGSFGVKTDPKFNSIRFPAVDPATGNVYVGDTWGTASGRSTRLWRRCPRSPRPRARPPTAATPSRPASRSSPPTPRTRSGSTSPVASTSASRSSTPRSTAAPRSPTARHSFAPSARG